MSIRILLVDDHQMMLTGLRTLLEREPDIEVIAEAEDGRAAVRLARELFPDVVVMDVTMPDLNGIVATRQIKGELPQIKILALSMHPTKRFVSEMLRAGASGYLIKNCAFEELVHAVRTVNTGQTYLSPAIAGLVVEDYVRGFSIKDKSIAPTLSDREREVLQLVAEGKCSKEIAAILQVSVKTVDAHRQHIMNKLNIRSVAEITKYAIQEGLTSLET